MINMKILFSLLFISAMKHVFATSVCFPENDITEAACQTKIAQCATANIELVWESCPPVTAAPSFFGDARVGGGGDSGKNDMGIYGTHEGRRRILKMDRDLQPVPPGPATPATKLGNCICRSCANYQCQSGCANDTSCAWNSTSGVCLDAGSASGRLLNVAKNAGPKVTKNSPTTSPSSSPTPQLCSVTASIPNNPVATSSKPLSCSNPQPWRTQTCIDPSNDPYICLSAISPIAGGTCSCMSTDSTLGTNYCMAFVSCNDLVEALTSEGGDFCSFNIENGIRTLNLNDPCYSQGGYCVFDCCSETFPICRRACTA